MKRIMNYFKNDYRNVKEAIKILSKDKAPNWVIMLYYVTFVILFFPVIILVLVAYQIFRWHILRKIKKLEKEIEMDLMNRA